VCAHRVMMTYILKQHTPTLQKAQTYFSATFILYKNRSHIFHFALQVNSSKVIVVQYDHQNNKEMYMDKDNQLLLSVSYDKAGQPISWNPADHGSPFRITYDRFNRLESWIWGDQAEKYQYDRHGLLSEVITGEKDSTQYTYNEQRMVSLVCVCILLRFAV